MVKPIVDKEKCIGCGACAATYPDVFELGADGKASVKKAEVDPKEVEIDVGICPVGAISLKG